MICRLLTPQQYYAPDFELNVRSSNMENSNSREYLEKITAAVVDNLRQTGPAPSVQLQDVPRKPFGGMTDEEEAELDDLDEDENKDVRMTEHRWDKHVENDAELEASDDEDMSRANGITRLGNNKRTFTDYRKGEKVKEGDSSRASPANGPNSSAPEEPVVEESHDINDDTIEDVAAAELERALVETPNSPKGAVNAKVDGDGDVGMADSTVVEEAEIKQEDVQPEKASEHNTKEKSVEAKPKDEAEQGGETAEEASSEKAQPTDDAPEKPTEESTVKETVPQPGDTMDVDQDNDKVKDQNLEADKEVDKETEGQETSLTTT